MMVEHWYRTTPVAQLAAHQASQVLHGSEHGRVTRAGVRVTVQVPSAQGAFWRQFLYGIEALRACKLCGALRDEHAEDKLCPACLAYAHGDDEPPCPCEGHPSCPDCNAPTLCHRCGRPVERGACVQVLVDLDPGDPEVGPQPDIQYVDMHGACAAQTKRGV